jgi:hypothetical protein
LLFHDVVANSLIVHSKFRIIWLGDDLIGPTREKLGLKQWRRQPWRKRCYWEEAELAMLKTMIAEMEEKARAASALEKEKSVLKRNRPS